VSLRAFVPSSNILEYFIFIFRNKNLFSVLLLIIVPNKKKMSCQYIMKQGMRRGECCNKNVTKKDDTFQWCISHWNANQKQYDRRAEKFEKENEQARLKPVEEEQFIFDSNENDPDNLEWLRSKSETGAVEVFSDDDEFNVQHNDETNFPIVTKQPQKEKRGKKIGSSPKKVVEESIDDYGSTIGTDQSPFEYVDEAPKAGKGKRGKSAMEIRQAGADFVEKSNQGSIREEFQDTFDNGQPFGVEHAMTALETIKVQLRGISRIGKNFHDMKRVLANTLFFIAMVQDGYDASK
jgi:hypothetical protein